MLRHCSQEILLRNRYGDNSTNKNRTFKLPFSLEVNHCAGVQAGENKSVSTRSQTDKNQRCSSSIHMMFKHTRIFQIHRRVVSVISNTKVLNSKRFSIWIDCCYTTFAEGLIKNSAVINPQCRSIQTHCASFFSSLRKDRFGFCEIGIDFT